MKKKKRLVLLPKFWSAPFYDFVHVFSTVILAIIIILITTIII